MGRTTGGLTSLAVALIATSVAAAALRAGQRAIEASKSTLTIHVGKSGLFSAFADNHVVRAPIARGTLNQDAVEIQVQASALTVLDPDQSEGTRADIERRMQGPEVLDSARFPEITFKSTIVEPAASHRWRVTGDLSLHGRTRSLSVIVDGRDGHYLGRFVLRQRDFGIEPISIAGGTVKVKDELAIEFDIVAGQDRHE